MTLVWIVMIEWEHGTIIRGVYSTEDRAREVLDALSDPDASLVCAEVDGHAWWVDGRFQWRNTAVYQVASVREP